LHFLVHAQEPILSLLPDDERLTLMSSTRVFLLSPALARLIERDRPGDLVRQGYFPEHLDRSTHVQVSGDAGHLILASHSARGPIEQAAEISLPQAEALLALSAGQVEYLSIVIDVGPHATTIQRFITPGPLDLISMAFGDDKTDRKFQPPAWFGPEVSADPSYRLRAIALTGQLAVPEVEILNAALASLLEALDSRDREAEPSPTRQAPAPAPSEAPDDAEANHEFDGLTIEDSVIRDLARSLQPQRR
jgi:CYTH domain-containing protein